MGVLLIDECISPWSYVYYQLATPHCASAVYTLTVMLRLRPSPENAKKVAPIT